MELVTYIILSVLNTEAIDNVGSGRAIFLTMEAVSTSETSVAMYQTTQRNIPEYSHLHIRCCD
jgi:hypothetical protein